MKKATIFLTVIFATFTIQTANAQEIQIFKKNKTVISVPFTELDSIVSVNDSVNHNFDKAEEETFQQIRNTTDTQRKPFITFTADDGYNEDITILAPIMLAAGYPCCLAMESDEINHLEERLNLQNSHGWEIMCHASNPTPFNQLTMNEVKENITNSKKILEQKGFIINDFVYPSGISTDKSGTSVKPFLKKHFRAALCFNGNKVYRLNKGILDSYTLHRIPIGDHLGISSNQNTLQYYKECVDEAIKNNAWIIFAIHAQPGKNSDFNKTQQQHLKDLLLYIKSKGDSIKVGNISEGYEMFGNLMESGNSSVGEGEDDLFYNRFVVTNDGQTNIPVQHLRPLSITNNDNIDKFPSNKVSIAQISNWNAEFPTKHGGILSTYNFDNWKFQIWNPNSESSIYRRKWTGKWEEWTRLSICSSSDAPLAFNGTLRSSSYNIAKPLYITTSIFVDKILYGAHLENKADIVKPLVKISELSSDVVIAKTKDGREISIKYDGDYLQAKSSGEDIGNAYFIFYAK